MLRVARLALRVRHGGAFAHTRARVRVEQPSDLAGEEGRVCQLPAVRRDRHAGGVDAQLVRDRGPVGHGGRPVRVAVACVAQFRVAGCVGEGEPGVDFGAVGAGVLLEPDGDGGGGGRGGRDRWGWVR